MLVIGFEYLCELWSVYNSSFDGNVLFGGGFIYLQDRKCPILQEWPTYIVQYHTLGNGNEESRVGQENDLIKTVLSVILVSK